MRNESDWAYLPQSEERVVSKQIKERSRLDAAFHGKEHSSAQLEAAGGYDVAQAVQCTYIDLTRQIDACAFPSAQQQVLDMLMEGYSLRDIAELQARDVYEIERAFRNAVHSIVRQNDLSWKKHMASVAK